MNLTEHRLQLRAAGFAPIPVNGKESYLGGWSQMTDVDSETIALWEKQRPDHSSTGLLTQKMPTLDIDIKNKEASEAIEALIRKRFETRGCVLTRIGLAPKRAVPFRTNAVFKKITQNFLAPDATTNQKLEFLSNGQQLVAFGVHPDTHKPYQWFGGEPGQIKLEQLPSITEAEAQQLVNDATKLLANFGYQPTKARPKSDSDAGAGSEDWNYLLANIRAGHELHDSIRDLAAKLIVAGMGAGAAVNLLRAAMEQSTALHDERWQERYDDISRLVESAEEKFNAPKEAIPPPTKCSLDDVQKVFRKWLGEEYDIDAINATCAAAASERLTGDPLWLLIISGPGAAKTETVQALGGAGAHVTSTIASEGALLSASPKRSRSKQATGGLLRKIGAHGVLVIKDFTSIISAARETRGSVLAAIREIYDGRWERNVGTDGGQSLTWIGRIVIVGAVTTAWDAAHAVVAACGDRFVLIRINSNLGRKKSGKRAIRNTGDEIQMRKELAAAVGGLITNANTDDVTITEDEIDRLLNAADVVTMARTAVERDYRGEVVNSHAPEMPTRFAKQLTQTVRGGIAIGLKREAAMRLALRCARDSIPPLRLAILLDVAANSGAQVGDVRKRIGKPWSTVKKEMEGLTMLGMLKCDEEIEESDGGDESAPKKQKTRWLYDLGDDVDVETLRAMGQMQPEPEIPF